jgi:PAS domain S-box-containing protein
MSGEGDVRGPAMLRLLLGPSERILGEEERSSAQLIAALTLVHLLATLVGAVVGTVSRRRLGLEELLWGPLGWVLLVGAVFVLIAYLLVRTGWYRAGLVVYIATTAAFPLLAPLVGGSMRDIGLLATALIPMVLASTLLAPRRFMVVAAGVVLIATVELSLVSWPRSEVSLGYTLLLVVFGSGALMLVMRRHQVKLEALRAQQLRRSEAALRLSRDRMNALLETSHDLVSVLDAKGARKAVFGAVTALTGYAIGERGPLSHFETMHPDDRARVQQEFVDLLNHPGSVARTEWRYLHRDGRYRWHEGLVSNRLRAAVSHLVQDGHRRHLPVRQEWSCHRGQRRRVPAAWVHP